MDGIIRNGKREWEERKKKLREKRKDGKEARDEC